MFWNKPIKKRSTSNTTSKSNPTGTRTINPLILVARLTAREYNKIFLLCHCFATTKQLWENESYYLRGKFLRCRWRGGRDEHFIVSIPHLSRASYSWKKYPASLTSEGQQFFRLYQVFHKKIRAAITLYREQAFCRTLDSQPTTLTARHDRAFR